MKALDVLALSKKYTSETADAMGAVKGAPATILEIIPSSDGTYNDVTFQWTGTSGEKRTTILRVMNGEKGDVGDDGNGISDITSSGNVITIILDDGTQKTFEIPSVESTSLDLLSDVEIDSETLEDGQNLIYDLESGKWINGSGGGSSTAKYDYTTSVEVGGLEAGTSISKDELLSDIIKRILTKVYYPTFTAPSASISASPSTKIFEKGATANITFTLSLNRGKINPAYGTSGYRSGVATGYSLNGGETQSTNTFTETVSSSQLTYRGTVSYAEGEQPKDSTGANYSTPLSAGSVNTSTITYEFVEAIWANTSNIASVAKQSLVSKGSKVKEFNFPAQTVANPEVFDVPSSWNVTAVEVLNTLSNQWENCASEFSTSSTTHNDASGAAVNYTRYTDNRGYAAGARKVRVRWS